VTPTTDALDEVLPRHIRGESYRAIASAVYGNPGLKDRVARQLRRVREDERRELVRAGLAAAYEEGRCAGIEETLERSLPLLRRLREAEERLGELDQT
jgi:hypothetical protein